MKYNYSKKMFIGRPNRSG